MSFLSALPIVGSLLKKDGIVSQVIDTLDADERRAAELEMAAVEGALQLNRGQQEINKVEAAHSSVFVAGWRPFIGWMSGIAIGFHAFGLGAILEKYLEIAIVTDFNMLYPLVLALLGTSGLRTMEKFRGVNRNSL